MKKPIFVEENEDVEKKNEDDDFAKFMMQSKSGE